MEPDRFDDVAFTVTEEPQEPSPRSLLRRRVAAVLTAATLVFGGLAAGADALTDSGDAAPAAKGGDLTPVFRNSEGVPVKRSGAECRAGERHRSKPSRDLEY